MLHAVAFLGTLAIVETVQGAHQIARDAADALKGVAVFAASALGAGYRR